MESQAARRRISAISGHLVAGLITEDVTALTTHISPMNCSSNLMRTPFRRLDSRMHYGRQASAFQGYFMRQANSQTEQENPVSEEKQIAPAPPLFSRPGTTGPLFGRPKAEFSFPNVGAIESRPQDKISPASKCPKFGRPVQKLVPAEMDLTSRSLIIPSQAQGLEWRPRINVAESKFSYDITVELPGVDIRDIRVEMDVENLTVRGNRSMKWCKADGCPSDYVATYHRREISHGPFQVVWPLPARANKDSVSAEFVEGILQITIPKV